MKIFWSLWHLGKYFITIWRNVFLKFFITDLLKGGLNHMFRFAFLVFLICCWCIKKLQKKKEKKKNLSFTRNFTFSMKSSAFQSYYQSYCNYLLKMGRIDKAVFEQLTLSNFKKPSSAALKNFKNYSIMLTHNSGKIKLSWVWRCFLCSQFLS